MSLRYIPASGTEHSAISFHSVSINQNTLTADVSDAQYQWIDCNDNNQPIEGASGQAFTPQQNGNYAVIITQGPCQVTSECIEVIGVGIEKNITPEKVRVFPNPARDEVIVETALSGKIRIISSSGKVLIAEEILSKRTRLDVSELSIGLYMLRFSSEEGTEVKKLVIQHSVN